MDYHTEAVKRFLSLCERAAQSGGVGIPASPDTCIAETSKVFASFIGDVSQCSYTLRHEIAATYGSVAAWYSMLYGERTPKYSMKKIARIACESLSATQRRGLAV